MINKRKNAFIIVYDDHRSGYGILDLVVPIII